MRKESADQFNRVGIKLDATDAALRRRNQEQMAGLRQAQAPRHAAVPAREAADARLAEK
jgi:hypothetical protein